MKWKVTTQPAFEPITLEHLKQHARIDSTDEDEILTSYISAARAFVERRIEMAVCEQTITAKLDGFPYSDGRIDLPYSNLIAVDSVSYLDADGAPQTPHPTGSPQADYYGVDTYTTPGALFLKSGQTWPSDVLQEPNVVTIVYRAGWADRASIPEQIRQAVTLLAAHWERNRETVNFGEAPAEIEFTLSALIDQFRVYWR